MLSTLILVFYASAAFAGDLGLDTTFSLPAGAFNTVYDIHVLSDGKVIAAGTACGSSSCTPIVRRLNADGSIDTSFSVQLNPLNQGGGHARYVKPLSNGQFLITGDFNIGTTRSSFVRINADGSIDATMAPRYLVVADIEPTVDGKYIVCGSGVVNGENYGTAYRLNNDGTSDPSFRITFITGHCGGVRSLADGKFLITANAVSGEPAIKPVHKLNNDGSQDTSFTTDIPAGSTARGLTLLPDGKILVGSYGVGGENVSRLTSTGATEMSTSLCRGDLFVPLPNGDVLTTNCRKWSGAILSLIVARMRPNGTVDPKFDDVYIDVNQGAGLLGFRDAGNGKFYAFGGFGGVNGVYGPSTQYLIRLAPNNTPPRAKFDFDGDGKSDLAVFRPSDRTWYLRQSTLGDAYVVWGLATDRPAATHFDNDGRTNVVVFRNGVWHANSPIFGWIQMNSGVAGDQPIVGNFDDFGLNLEDYAVRGLRSGVVQWSVIQGNLTQPNPSGSGLGSRSEAKRSRISRSREISTETAAMRSDTSATVCG
jgi:uncharacterized delta-60 repeat protein